MNSPLGASESVLDFDLLDDILNLTPDAYLPIARSSRLDSLAPLVEFIYHDYSNRTDRLQLWPLSSKIQQLDEALRCTRLEKSVTPISGFPKSWEFMPTPRCNDDILHAKWASYLLRAQKAAEYAGINKAMAQALIGTLEEMVDNIIWHSQAVPTGICGYQWRHNMFEYVVADAGQGVLATLKTNPNLSTLNDAGDALSMALQSGVTRFGEIDRGTGFNMLIRNIAKNSCVLRFHSDDACITFDGIVAQQTGKICQTSSYVPHLRGFVISVRFSI